MRKKWYAPRKKWYLISVITGDAPTTEEDFLVKLCHYCAEEIFKTEVQIRRWKIKKGKNIDKL